MTSSYRLRRRPSAKKIVRELFLNVFGLVVIAIILFPIYWALRVAGSSNANILVQAPNLLPFRWVATNFRVAWHAESGNIATSLIVAICVVAIGLLVATPAAYGLKRFRNRSGGIVIGTLLLTQMVPSIALSIAFYALFRRLGLLNGYAGLILADSTYAVPLMVVLLRAFLEAVPVELIEAAQVDGANEFRCAWSIVLPVAVPGIITAGMFGFLLAWGDFLFGLTLNSGGTVQPVTLGLYKFVGVYSTEWGPIMATVILAAIPAAVVLAFGQRWVSGGLRAGALKG
jgi:multiple sugar transport system permease protein